MVLIVRFERSSEMLATDRANEEKTAICLSIEIMSPRRGEPGGLSEDVRDIRGCCCCAWWGL